MGDIKKVDIRNSERVWKTASEGFEAARISVSENKNLILEYIEHLKLRDTSPRRLAKVLNHLKVLSEWYGKEFTKIMKVDNDRVITGLRNDTFKKHNVKFKRNPTNPDERIVLVMESDNAYSPRTKLDFVKIMRQFARWLNRKKLLSDFEDKFETFCYNIKKSEKVDPTILRREEVELIANSMPTLQKKCLVMLLFDSGIRPEEMANVRVHDVSWDAERKKYWVHVTFPKEQSYARSIDVPVCTNLLKEYLHVNEDFQRKSLTEPLFKTDFNSLRILFQERCSKLLNRCDVNLYTLRHSSVQFYCDEVYNGNVKALCDRYGWSYSTRMLQVYLSRSKARLPDGSELANKDRIQELELNNECLQRQLEQHEKQVENLQQKHQEQLQQLQKQQFETERRLWELSRTIGQTLHLAVDGDVKHISVSGTLYKDQFTPNIDYYKKNLTLVNGEIVQQLTGVPWYPSNEVAELEARYLQGREVTRTSKKKVYGETGTDVIL